MRLHAVNCSQGQSAVEMALILPIILILLVGIVTSGFMFYANPLGGFAGLAQQGAGAAAWLPRQQILVPRPAPSRRISH
mgnify:CR=1 FL=1